MSHRVLSFLLLSLAVGVLHRLGGAQGAEERPGESTASAASPSSSGGDTNATTVTTLPPGEAAAERAGVEGSSRLSLGGDNLVSPLGRDVLKPPKFLMVLYSAWDNRSYEGLLQGMGIRISDRCFIADVESFISTGLEVEGSLEKDTIEWTPSSTINVDKGADGKPRDWPGAHFLFTLGYELAVFNIRGRGSSGSLYYPPYLRPGESARLDPIGALGNDTSEPDRNYKYCWAFSWSQEGHLDAENVSSARHFSKWPVKITKCTQVDCTFDFDDRRSSKRGARCGWRSDIGAPISCNNGSFVDFIITRFTGYHPGFHPECQDTRFVALRSPARLLIHQAPGHGFIEETCDLKPYGNVLDRPVRRDAFFEEGWPASAPVVRLSRFAKNQAPGGSVPQKH